jgi:hypothetical protein
MMLQRESWTMGKMSNAHLVVLNEPTGKMDLPTHEL